MPLRRRPATLRSPTARPSTTRATRDKSRRRAYRTSRAVRPPPRVPAPHSAACSRRPRSSRSRAGCARRRGTRRASRSARACGSASAPPPGSARTRAASRARRGARPSSPPASCGWSRRGSAATWRAARWPSPFSSWRGGLAQHLDVVARLRGGDGEAVLRLVGAVRLRAAPRSADELAAHVVGSLPRLEALRGLGRDAARVRLLLVERARDDGGDHQPQPGVGVADRGGDAQPRVVDALLARRLGELVQRVAAHLAFELDEASFPFEVDAARRAGRRHGALVSDAQADERGVEDVNARAAEPSQQRTVHDDALVLAAFGRNGHARPSFYASAADQRDSIVQTPTAMKPTPATSLSVCGRT